MCQISTCKLDLHIEVGYDNFAEDAKEEPQVENVVFLDLMCVQGVEAKAVCQNWDYQIGAVANIEDLSNSAHTGIAVDFAELRHDEVFIYEDVDDKA